MNQISNINQMIGGNPDAYFNQMLQTNPRFAQFIQENKGMSPEQIASKYGVDINAIKPFMR